MDILTKEKTGKIESADNLESSELTRSLISSIFQNKSNPYLISETIYIINLLDFFIESNQKSKVKKNHKPIS